MAPRHLGLRLEQDDLIVEVVAPGCPEPWPSVGLLSGGWLGAAASGGLGMSIEDDGGGARLVLEEQTGYTVRVVGRSVAAAGLGAATTAALSGPAAPQAVFRLDTGNLVGITDLVLAGPDGSTAATIPARIRVRKLGDPDADFAWLVDSIVDSVRALALTVDSATSLRTRRAARGPSYAYEDLVFLRAIAAEAERCVARIARNPHRRIVGRVEVRDAWLATEVAPGGLAALAADPRSLAAVRPEQQRRLLAPAARPRFTRPDRLLAPTGLPATLRQVSYDTYENRFVRYVVTAFRLRALAISNAFRAAGRSRLEDEARALVVRFGALLRLEPFDEVGTLAAFSSTSQVLLREDAYNALLRLYREFLLTADVVWDAFRALQANRNVAELYEMWVYIETVRAVATILGAHSTVEVGESDLVRIDADGLHVNLATGTASLVTFRTSAGRLRVAYNRTYSGGGAGPRANEARSYSLDLRPDVAVEIERDGRVRRLFLDAKYRVDALGDVFSRVGGDEDDGTEPRGTFKRSDVYKMHTYRDAIGGAHAAVAVYPGTERRLFPAHPAAFASCGGVGAIPLRPRVGFDRQSFTEDVGRLLAAASAVPEHAPRPTGPLAS